jgi:hypothetical protein
MVKRVFVSAVGTRNMAETPQASRVLDRYCAPVTAVIRTPGLNKTVSVSKTESYLFRIYTFQGGIDANT